MEKRKSRDGGEEPTSKRRKFPEDEAETPQATKELGLKFVEMIKNTADKSGRLIATAFLTLPNKRELPEYYKETKMPIALDTIEVKLQRGEFPTLTSLEAYFKRMISNAKEFNERGSTVFEDAERLRKALSNYMTKTNPAYKTPGFACLPTPLPEEEVEAPVDDEEDAEGEIDPDAEVVSLPKKRGRLAKTTGRRTSSTPELPDAGSYAGLNFQEAQEKILADMISYKERSDDDFAGFAPFLELLDRSDFKDYYETIDHPVSLKQLQKHVKGVVGKKAATHISNFKHWAAFEEEMSYLWKNAFSYNIEGSAIFLLAEELKKFFYRCLTAAKRAVPEPAGPKIKLKMSEPAPKILLKFGGGGGKASPAESPAPLTNGSNGSNGSDAPVNGSVRRNPFGGASSTPVPVLDQLERARSISGSVPSPTPSNAAVVKNEEVARRSPSIAAGYSYSGGSQATSTPGLNGNGMPPPSTPGLPQQGQYSQGGYAQSFNHQAQYQPPNPGFESKWRPSGKDASDAMITNLSISTHPGLNISKHLRMNLPPSSIKTQQSVTINLPSTHYYLQIKPNIAISLRQRQYKLFVTSGTQRLHAIPIPGQGLDNLNPLFEARILPGVNRIEVELIAALPKDAPKLPNGQDVELEKFTIFANLMKA